MRKGIVVLALLILSGCINRKPIENKKQTYKEVDFQSVINLFYEKLKGQTLIRNYGGNTGQTKIIFENKGTFRGDYFGKIASDGQDYGLSWKAASSYGGEEIHSSNFEGRFEITEALDDYTYKLKLKSFKITSKEGAHDDIYYNVNFALGLNPEASYLLYRPGCQIKNLDKDQRLIEIAKKTSPDGEKTRGFIIYNKTDGEVFSQNP